jgi:DNA replicative helicase MCM subunit Mcm2 (Cdc46/Mcm family)
MTTRLPPPKKSSIYSDFDAAKEKLLTAIHRGPFYGLLVGESGTGKSSLLRRVAAICDRHRYHMLYLSGSQTTKSGLGRYLVDVLNLARRRSHALFSVVFAGILTLKTKIDVRSPTPPSLGPRSSVRRTTPPHRFHPPRPSRSTTRRMTGAGRDAGS